MTIDEIHRFISVLKNKGQSRRFTPEEIDLSLNAASINLYNREKRRHESDREGADRLANFKAKADVALTAGNGALPADYDMVRFVNSGVTRVEIVPDTEWASRESSIIAPPTATYPICLVNKDVEVRPVSITTVRMYYFKVPATMKWDYTISSNREVYNPAGTTVQPDWPESVHVEIVEEACSYLGVSLNERDLTQLRQYQTSKE